MPQLKSTRSGSRSKRSQSARCAPRSSARWPISLGRVWRAHTPVLLHSSSSAMALTPKRQIVRIAKGASCRRAPGRDRILRPTAHHKTFFLDNLPILPARWRGQGFYRSKRRASAQGNEQNPIGLLHLAAHPRQSSIAAGSDVASD